MSRVLAGAALLLMTGCTSGVVLPKTYPAGGTVVYKGGQPMTGGSVQFSLESDPLLRVMGAIQNDGAFTLTTTKENTRADGAPEGDYKVLVTPPLISDPRGGVEGAHKGAPPVMLPKTLRIEPNESNTFKIELPNGPPSRS